MSTAEYQRQWRARHGAHTGRPGPDPHPCGSPAGYNRHRRHHEEPCQPCREAWTTAQRDWARARRARQKEARRSHATQTPTSNHNQTGTDQ